MLCAAQLKLIHNMKMSDLEKKPFVSVLHENTLQCMQSLLKAVTRFGLKIDSDLTPASERVLAAGKPESVPEEFIMSPELAEDVGRLWKAEAVQEAYKRRSEFWILDGADYYFNHCKEFAAKGYAPTEEDIIMARARTTGIILTEARSCPAFFRFLSLSAKGVVI